MQPVSVDFYFDFISPYSYLASTQLQTFSARHHCEFNWLPVNLPRLIKLSGNVSPVMVRNKARYALRDLKRWAAYLDVPLKMIRPGSFDSRPALRVAGALPQAERSVFGMAVFNALWRGQVDVSRDDWLAQIFALNHLPGHWLKQQNEGFERYTRQALEAGAFGAPTFILHAPGRRPEMFFGVDHMDFLARACDALLPVQGRGISR